MCPGSGGRKASLWMQSHQGGQWGGHWAKLTPKTKQLDLLTCWPDRLLLSNNDPSIYKEGISVIRIVNGKGSQEICCGTAEGGVGFAVRGKTMRCCLVKFGQYLVVTTAIAWSALLPCSEEMPSNEERTATYQVPGTVPG
jgi:hypothetical protein